MTQLGLAHLSLYHLTIEPDTPFGKLHRGGGLSVADEERSVELLRVNREIVEVRRRLRWRTAIVRRGC